ncbi:MAG TPA: helix-turn-helix domain-containing protein [Chryseolinea sp.]|nr:helix-turn-helix domain-containing protein [Chryseolinea sp.]
MTSTIILNGIEVDDLMGHIRMIVRDEIASIPKPTQVKEYLTLTEVAALIGRPKSSIYQLTHAGQIPHVKIGAVLMLKRADIDKWIASKQVVK